jgi:hypothetical protein
MEVVMQLGSQHWHVAVTYPGYHDGFEDQPFQNVDSALDYANQTWDTFRQDGHQVTELDRPDDDRTGVIERYLAADREGGTVAVVEVRPCYKDGCLSLPSFPFRATAADSWWLRLNRAMASPQAQLDRWTAQGHYTVKGRKPIRR